MRIRSNIALTIRSVSDWNQGLMRRAAAGLDRGLLHAAAISQTRYLQGPRPRRLGEVTTTLRRSISTRVRLIQDTVRGELGSNVVYAGYHEFGFHGTQHVRAHTRIIRFTTARGSFSYSRMNAIANIPSLKRLLVRDAAGRPVGFKRSLKGQLKRQQSVGQIQLNEIHVRAHDRQVDYPGRPFLRPALAEAMPVILAQIRRAIQSPPQT